MKILVLAGNLDESNGWGRYTRGLLAALASHDVSTTVVMGRSGSAHASALPLLPDPLQYRRICLLAPWYAWKLRTYASGSDIIHSFIEPYAPIAYWLSRLTSKPYVITAHGTYSTLPYTSAPYLRRAHHRSFARAARIVCVSRYTQEALAAHGLAQLTVIHNGLTFSAFYTPSAVPFAKRSELVLSVGALKHRKGLHVSLAAFAQVHRQRPFARYVIVGDTSDAVYMASLGAQVKELGLEGFVEFRGTVTEDELRELYAQSRVFVLTPVSEGGHFEGFGLVYLEANAAGVPVVGSTGSGAEEAIENGQTGLLVPPNDPAATADAIMKILADDAGALRLSTQAVAWARAHDWGHIAAQYTALYQEVHHTPFTRSLERSSIG